MAEAPIEITDEHIDRIEKIACSLARTTMGELAGADELRSEALVVLWTLALEWNANFSVPFTAYISLHGRRRLIDWLRTTYGRASNNHITPRMAANLATLSIEEMSTDDDGTPRDDPRLVLNAPGPEDIAIARDEWQRFWQVVAALSPFQQRVLLWPVLEGTPQHFMNETGKSKINVSSRRSQTKAQVAAAIGRPLTRRTYRTKTPAGLKSAAVATDTPPCEATNGADTTQSTPPLGLQPLDHTPPPPRRPLDLERLTRPRRIRPDQLRLPTSPPLGLRTTSGPHPPQTGDRPHMPNPGLRQPPTPRTSDTPRKRTPQKRIQTDAHRSPNEMPQRPQPRRDAKVVQQWPATLVVHLVRPDPEEENRMNNRKPYSRSFRHVPDQNIINDRATMTLNQIAHKYGVHPSTVSVRLKKLGHGQPPRPRYQDVIPWRVAAHHDQDTAMYYLRLLGRYRHQGTVPTRRHQALTNWITERITTNTTVDYHPDTGFTYTPATTTTPEQHPYYEPTLITPTRTHANA